MYFNKHFPGPQGNRDNSQMKIRPGQFSNHGSITSHQDREQNQRSKSPTPIQYDQRKFYKEPNPNISFEGISRIHTHVTTDNEQYHPLFEQPPVEAHNDYYFANYDSVCSSQTNERQILAPKSTNVQTKNPSRNSSCERLSKKVAPDTQPKLKKNLSNAHLQKSAGNSGQKYVSRTNAYTKAKVSSDANQMSYGKLPRYQENDENYDVNIQNLAASRSSTYSKSNEKRKPSQHLDYSITQEFSSQNEECERVKRENFELRNAISKLTGELQTEKSKSESVENEINMLTNNITEERAKYQGELMKISMQIKKLRNIQNIYVNEKKNSERLEAELNDKNRILEQVSCFSADCIRSMLITLEYLLVKGDLHFEKQEFNPSDYLRLIYEIRKTLLPSVELAESFSLPNEWKISDYQQIISHTKEMMKLRKSNNFYVEQKNLLSQYGSNDRKNTAALSTQYSSKQTTSRSNTGIQVNTNLTPQTNNFTTFSNTPSETSKNVVFENHNQTSLAYSTKTTEPKPAKANNVSYMPFNSRINIIEQFSNRDDFEEMITKEHEHLFEGSPQASVRKEEYRNHSQEAEPEDQEGNPENMEGSLGSTILPRTNNCSGFNETFENLITEKLQEERRLSEITISNSYMSKNYDLPLSTFNNGYAEPNKNKNFKKKTESDSRDQKIEIIKPASNSVTYMKDQSQDGVQVTMGELESESMTHQDFFTGDGPNKPTQEKYVISNGYAFSPREEYEEEAEEEEPHFKGYEDPLKQDIKNSDYSSNQDSPQNRETPFIHESHSKKVLSAQNSSQKNLAHQFSLQASPAQNKTKDTTPISMKKDTMLESRSSLTDSVSGQFVIAKYDFKAQKENDLEFTKGDRIQILKKTENGWWIGLSNNKIGYFPYNFVNITE